MAGTLTAPPRAPVALEPALEYERHRPETTLLYQLVETHLAEFAARMQAQGSGLPDFVMREFEAFLECGRLEGGFVRGESCRHEKLVAFSCKRRGFCPSCGGRRMAETAAFLVDEVFPHQPVRQWVITFPFELRFLFAAHPKTMGQVLGIVNRAVSSFIINRSGLKLRDAKTGAVTLIQRFGSALNLNIHFHMLFLDGAYRFTETDAQFERMTPPSPGQLEELLHTISTRVTRHLERRGLLVREDERVYLGLDTEDAFDHVLGSAITYRVAFGPHQGRKALVLRTLTPLEGDEPNSLLAKVSGFTLHASTCCEAHERDALERLSRYISRPAIANERLSLDGGGRVVYTLKNPYRDGTTHIVLDPVDFLARLAALVPRPRVNLIRFHGLFAPNCKERARVLPTRRAEASQSMPTPARSRYRWATLLARVFNIDIETCRQCGGKLRVIACIDEPPVIEKILRHLRAARDPAPSQLPRAPPPSAATHAPTFAFNEHQL